MGLSFNHAEWDDEQHEIIREIIDEGTRNAYFPPPLPPPYSMSAGGVHEWTFMRPTWEVTTVADQRRYSLPADFERPIGQLSFKDEDNAYLPVKFVPSSRLRNLENRLDFTAQPEFAAIEPAESTGQSPQEMILVLHPTPDAAYPMVLQYQAQARRLSEDSPYALGGQTFGPVILASCLAMAELRKGAPGPMSARFYEVLAGAIVRDRARGPAYLGYNGNQYTDSVGRGGLRHRDGIWYGDVTYGGVLYSGE